MSHQPAPDQQPDDEELLDPRFPENPQLISLVERVKSTAIEWLKVYHRHEVILDAPVPDQPCMIVTNHGFGGYTDLNIWAFYRTIEEVDFGRTVTFLVHQVSWDQDWMGKLTEASGAVRANPREARAAWKRGEHVVVLPGGDLEASKPFWRRNKVDFFGRSGFARLAMENDIPIIPVVTAGAGEGQLVLTDGQRLAKALKLPERVRYNAMPISIAWPFGLTVNVTGLQASFPLPTKLKSAVLPALTARPDESPEEYAKRVQAAMQKRMDRLVKGRIPIIG